MNDKEFDNIGHALGVNVYHCRLSKSKKDKFLPDEFYRNYYCCCRLPGLLPDEFKELLENELIETWEKFSNLNWSVTKKGIKEFRDQFQKEITAKYQPQSKSKQTYQDFIDADYGHDFTDYLNIQMPKVEYKHGYYRYCSVKYKGVNGSFKTLKKDAKESYKKAVKDYKELLNN